VTRRRCPSGHGKRIEAQRPSPMQVRAAAQPGPCTMVPPVPGLLPQHALPPWPSGQRPVPSWCQSLPPAQTGEGSTRLPAARGEHKAYLSLARATQWWKKPRLLCACPPSFCTSSVPGTRSRRASRRLWLRTRHQDGPWCGGLGRHVCCGPGPVDGTTARCVNKRGGSCVRSSSQQVIGRCGPRGRGGRGAGGVRWVVTPGGTAHEDGPSRRCPKAAQDGSSTQEPTGRSEGPNGRPRPRRLQSRPTRPRLSPRTSCLRIPWPPARRLGDDAGRPLADGPIGRPRRQADSPHASRCPGGCLMASAGP